MIGFWNEPPVSTFLKSPLLSIIAGGVIGYATSSKRKRVKNTAYGAAIGGGIYAAALVVGIGWGDYEFMKPSFPGP